MDYGEELAKRPEFWARMAEEGKGPLANEPEVPIAGQEAWQAFGRMAGDRAIGMGAVGRIAFTAIDRYAERYGVEDFETFHRLVMALDGAYTERVNK
jgi:hypothetical protein